MTDAFFPSDDDAGFDEDGFDAACLRATIDLGAIKANWLEMQRLSGRARTAAVVKANAYGMGIEPVAETLYAAGARDFFVATAQEGAELRPFAPDARIFVLSGLWPGLEPVFFDYELVPVINSEEQLAFFMALLAEHGEYPCALHVDTGMTRLGLSPEEALALADDPARPASFSPVLVMSHLACADTPDHPLNARQLALFRQVTEAFDGVEASLANSAGVHLGPDYHFDLTRPGIATYGGQAVNGATNAMVPVVTAEARILQIRAAKAGESVSYGAAAILARDSRIAIVGAGYADGFHRSGSSAGVPLRGALEQGAHGVLHGRRVPQIGRITMDLTMFDVTDVPGARAGDYVELFGPNLSITQAAAAAGTIDYELLTSLGHRYDRLYLDPED
ncbi:alanine racemase [Rhizobium rhizosphaerae]|uniref:Alanine racemase n=1 Tax=Xaviernesmea rhizosphaerae TaxID=1672749 RepID=A0A1Q9AKX3_9HYPH|nr:alanine racemase [Xaviernesmea rhizosphaerae]OLP55935.1 alanine racemase [Xaviernesmea rhizosphaerae]